jgi:hypothetical protein
MRNNLKLPGNKFCCRSASLTDYVQVCFVDLVLLDKRSILLTTDESISATMAPVHPVITIHGGGEALVNIETISRLKCHGR